MDAKFIRKPEIVILFFSFLCYSSGFDFGLDIILNFSIVY